MFYLLQKITESCQMSGMADDIPILSHILYRPTLPQAGGRGRFCRYVYYTFSDLNHDVDVPLLKETGHPAVIYISRPAYTGS